jgi:DNA-binding XRE family transcriptional regulator
MPGHGAQEKNDWTPKRVWGKVHPMTTPRKIGRRLRELRDALQITQQTVAQRSGIPESTVSKYERGLIMPSLPSVVALAKALECRSGDIMGDS